MKNLPVICQDLLKGCKVFAVVGALSLCCACGGGGSDSGNKPEENVSASPMSGEVVVNGNDVETKSGEETASEAKSEDSGAAGETADAGEGDGQAAPSAEASGAVAEGGGAAGAQAETAKPNAPKVKSVGVIRDPFNRFHGMPAVSTSLSGGVRPTVDKGRVAVSSAYRKRIAKKQEAAKPKPVVKVSKPNVKVTGILKSGSTYKAILQGPERAIMVSSGESIGGYRIAAVTDKDVTLVYKDKYKFVIPMEQETFGSKGTPDASAGNIGKDPLVSISK